jgi:hypothetical protein
LDCERLRESTIHRDSMKIEFPPQSAMFEGRDGPLTCVVSKTARRG